MKTTKHVAALVVIVALILGGCSSNDSTSGNKSTATLMSGAATQSTTMVAGNNSTSAPTMAGTDNTTGTTTAMTTPGAGNTTGTTTAMTTPDAGNTTGTPAGLTAVGTTDPNMGTSTVVGTMNAVGTTDPNMGTSTVVGTMSAVGTTTPMATTNAVSTTAPMATTNAVATTTPMATTSALSTTAPVATMAPTVDAMVTPTPTTTALNPTVNTGSVGTGQLLTLQSSFEEIYNQVNPSVVYIEVVLGSAASNSAGSGPMRASGSGFVWDAQGHIVTNNHVIDGATTVNVTFMDGTTVAAKVVGQDPNADLAVLQVTAASTELHPVKMGDSTKVRVGQIAIAIGNPYGLAGSMSEGIISALARSLPVESNNPNQNNQNNQNNQSNNNPTTGVYNIPNIIQTDAAINPGNSGGVLVNLQGEVIGVTAAIASQSQSNSGIGFVIPSEIVTKVVPDLISNGKYAHPWLGVTGMTLNPDVIGKMNLSSTQRGALVIAVSPSGPAETAGLMPSTVNNSTGSITTLGDVITAINGQPVRVFEDLGSYLFLHTKPGDVVTLTVMRDGKEQTVKVTLGTLPTP